MDGYSSKYLAGVIGEEEGRKWLIEQGYDVYEFRMIEFRFAHLAKVIVGLKKRRKKEYIEEDKARVNRLERNLKSIFGEKFEVMNQFFTAFLQQRREIWRLRRQTIGSGNRGIGPDFIVKKDSDSLFVEVKANTSTLSKYQKMCFKTANNYGFKTMVLTVKVETNQAIDFHLTEFQCHRNI
jgi:hypothetical protein